MPATPTRPPSTRISRRTSSRSVSNNIDDQPSTSTPSSSTPLNLPPPVAMETDEEVVVGGRGGRSRSNSRSTATTPDKRKRRSTAAAAAAATAATAPVTTEELEKEEDVVAEKPEKEVEMESNEKEKEDKVQTEQPKQPLKVIDRRVSWIIAEIITNMHRSRDKVTLENRKIRVQDVAQRKAAADIIRPVEETIRRVEAEVMRYTLDEVVKMPKYAVISDLVPPEGLPEEPVEPVEQQPGPSTRTMQPIEVKIEDADGSAAPSTSVLPSTSGFNGETNVERAAKREAHVLARIAELRKNGLWSNSRLPKCVEPERNKTHWDYLLEEVKWMASDFRLETAAKKKAARNVAVAIAKQHKEKEAEVARAAEREIKDKKKMCAGIARMIRQFWTNVDKFVDCKATEIREARIQKAKNQHLMFMLGQVGELSNVVQEGLVASQSPSIASHEDRDDKEFEAGSDSEDDEQTIANAEKSQKKDDVKKEVDALKDEANADYDDFLYTLPPEYLKAYGLTDEDVEDLKRRKKEADEKKEKEEAPKVVELPDEEDEKMEVDEEPAAATEPSTSKEKPKEQIQDTSAEDGNGDGRGVLANVDYLKLNSANSGERQQELNNIAEEALKFQPKGYTLETTVVNTPVPFLIRGTLREYQMVGLDWMVTLYEKNLNGILADEMGLGKTIQTISLLAHLACSEQIWGPHLIVVPTSVILNWEMEFKKWCPALKILTYFGTAKERAEKRKGWMKPNCFHVCITSYKTVTQDIRSFKQRAWQYLILDEAQNIKNWKSQRWQALLNVRARRRLLLTGTPLQNSLMELWSLMHFLMPTIFSSHDDFKDWFSNPLSGMMEGSVEVNSELIKSLHKVLRPFILRRLKKEVEKQLPAKTEHVIKCSLSKRQRYLYDDFMSRRSTKDNLKSGNMMSVLNIVMQLRKCCNHPNLFEPRPVLAPFVVPKLQVDVPSYLFDIAHQDPEVQEIPDIFNLQKIGYQPQSSGIYSQKKPLVVELEAMQQNILHEQPVPEVDGFRFNRTAFVTKMPPRVGEESEDEGVRTNGTTAPPAKVNGVNGALNGTPSTAPPVRPKTSTSTPLTINTAQSGFNFIMANTGRSRLDESARMSPPLKRAKLTGSSINWSDYVPQHVLEKMEDSRKNQLEIVRRRFGLIRAPIVPLEMVSLIREEIMSRFPRLVTDPDEKIQETLLDQVELLVQRFGMYVEPVLTDAWQCRPSSSGLPSYIRQNLANLEKDSHSLLLKSSSRLDTQMSISRSLQFPELRLIEYDCGKLQTLATLLRQLYAFKHRCLIFTQMSKMLDVLQTFLSHHGYQYFRLDGTTGVEQRQAMMERFNADPKVFCFILSTRSGGVGVNLTGADTVIFYDSDWNPTMDAQAQDRCHRIGQTRDVSIYRLISERTIEENILRKATEKRKLGEVAIDEAGFTPEFFKKSDNIRDLFAGEDVDVAAPVPEDVPMNQKDVEKALARCEDDVDVTAAKIADAEARLDTAEFDERMVSSTAKSQAEEETNERFMDLIQSMKPIERYAVNLLETQYKPDFEEECKEAEAQIHQKREEWDKNINEALDPENPDNLHNGDDMFNIDNDFYLNGNPAEVRKAKKKPMTASAKKSKFAPRARSPSKRKSLAPSFDPYVPLAPLALGSPPDSPRKKPARRSSNVGGAAGRGRPAGRKSVKKEQVEDVMTEDEDTQDSDYQDDDDPEDDDYKRPRGRPPLKRKRVVFSEPEPKNEPKKQRLAPNTPRPPPIMKTTPKATRPIPRPQFNQDLSTGPLSPSSLTSLPAQGPLTLTTRPAPPPPPVSLMPSTSASMPGPSMSGPSGGPRIARVPYHPPQHRPSMIPLKMVKMVPRPTQGGPVVRRIITGVSAGAVGRLPIPSTAAPRNLSSLSTTGISGIPIRNGPGAPPPRQFVIPTAAGAANRVRIYTAPPGTTTPRPLGPPTVSGSPNKMMYPVRIVQRPVMPAPIERPGFGIYERPRISLGSRRSRGEFEGANGSSPGPSTPRPQPPPPPPPPAPQA